VTAIPARDRLARTLRGDARAAFEVGLKARTEDLALSVEGIGPLSFPVKPSVARRLIGLARPARFGRGEETVTDPDVRNTWEVPKHLVHAGWEPGTLKSVLTTARDELGLPGAAELTADLHSLLVYEPRQFFLAHQDSEKDDLMIGTLVVTLPSTYTGGELVVRHHAKRTSHRGSKTELSLVAFYADCQHEVAEVRSGYRIALTYNLLLDRDVSRPEGDEATSVELASLLREHFSTPTPRYHGGPVTNPPKRLVYLLDHEYTPRALGWTRMKGADFGRVAQLRAAAEAAGCEAVLALAEVKTTHSAYEAGEGPEDQHDQYWDDDGDEDEKESGGSGDNEHEYTIEELIDSEVTLTSWADPDGTRLEKTSLFVGGDEVCASTGTDDLEPRSSEYEGYMGNWGNTLDRWYHRAAVVVWPREQGFANHAEASPGWALDELTAMASGGDPTGAQAAAATLQPFWDGILRTPAPEAKETVSELFGKALRTADIVADAATATMLLRPFRVENLAAAHVDEFGRVVSRYDDQWTAGLLRTWFGAGEPAWVHPGGPDRRQWVADALPCLCTGLHAAHGAAGATAAQGLLDLVWTWISRDIGRALASSRPSDRGTALADLGTPLASVLTAAAAVSAASTREAVTAYLRRQGDAVTALEMPLLRSAAEPREDSKRGDIDIDIGDVGGLVVDCAARLRARLARPRRAADDWSIALAAGGCACDLCDTLRAFLADPDRSTFAWPLAEARRRHVHSRIDGAELPVSHVTMRKGRPYTLVLRKTDALFTAETEARARDQADLEWLAATWNAGTS
jgi:hypothetical protein